MRLYPSGTRSPFSSPWRKARLCRLDSVQIQIDGQPVADHVYGFKELEALQKAACAIYTGNVATGEQHLESRSLEAGRRGYSGSERFAFRKDVKPAIVGISSPSARRRRPAS